MATIFSEKSVCIIVGASHAGVNCAFGLRKQGWPGRILLFDADPILPYHRPPLSKGYLSATEPPEPELLKAAASYTQEDIELHLGTRVDRLQPQARRLWLQDGTSFRYDYLVLATGASPLVPPIPGVDQSERLFTLRTFGDAQSIRRSFTQIKSQPVVIIGGGYIGLETAASLRQLGAEVKVLEREERLLGRVTSPAIADFFYRLHTDKGVDIQTQKEVVGIRKKNSGLVVRCADETEYPAGMVILGVGIRVNTRLAEEAGLEIEDGIRVDDQTRSSDPHIFAIGDCTRHYHAHYDRWLRLESVQNAVDQARVAAAVICGQDVHYSSIPWFWSDQFDVKLQMVGLSAGHNETIIRKEQGAPSSFSVWYFKGEELLAVDAVNNAKVYILGGKCIRGGKKIAKQALADPSLPLKPANILE